MEEHQEMTIKNSTKKSFKLRFILDFEGIVKGRIELVVPCICPN